MIENINTGVCARRVQSGEPCFFVNWIQGGEAHYRFFALRMSADSLERRLVELQKNGVCK